MIAITGATGQLGRLVINSLLDKTSADNIVALVRNTEQATDLKSLGIKLRQADYNQPETLTTALKGISKLLLISGNDVGNRVPQHQAVIDAAKAAGVELFAYTSILKADSNAMGLAAEHKETEAAIKASGLPAVILRNGWYSENYTQSIPVVLQTGTVAGAAADARLHTASRKDYAEAAATVLTSTEDQTGKVYELAGDSGYTLAEYAAEIAKQSGKTINYQNMTEEAFTDLLVQVGLPEGFAALLADSEVQAQQGALAEASGTLAQLIGRQTTPISQSITEAL